MYGVGESGIIHVCVIQISVLAGKVSTLNKEKETFQMKIRASAGERTGMIVIIIYIVK